MVGAPFAGFPSTLYNRARDQQFVLNYLADESHFLSDLIDTDNAAIIGYTMGGYGAINTVGGCYNFDVAKVQALGYPADVAAAMVPIFNSCAGGQADRSSVDGRWKAIIALAPWGAERELFNLSDVGAISVPSLYVVGDQDDVSGYENGVKRLFDSKGTADR